MIAQRLKEYLDREGVPYSAQPHSTAYTAQETAAVAHVPGKHFAKTVIVNINGRSAMVVLPAHRKVILQDLRDITGEDRVTFASEADFAARFPDCEPGAMPPFGNLYGMDVFVAPELSDAEEIVFNAGTHDEVIHMAYRDFERLVYPRVMSFTT